MTDFLDSRHRADGRLVGTGPLGAHLISASGHNFNFATGRDEAANRRLPLRLFWRSCPELGSRLQGWLTSPPGAASCDGKAQKADANRSSNLLLKVSFCHLASRTFPNPR